MIEFQSLDLTQKTEYDNILLRCGERGCEYSFVNLFVWGRQRAAFLGEQLVFFSQFNRKSVYLFPVGNGDRKPALDAVMEDAKKRDIPCRLTGLLKEDCEALEKLYPGMFRFHNDRNSYDYIYDINELADLPGRKFQRKRNQVNRFLSLYPKHSIEPITEEAVPEIAEMLHNWYAHREETDPNGDYHMEKAAIGKALANFKALHMDGIVLRVDGKIAAVTMASPLSEDTFDIHFEKAREDIVAGYAMINRCFARYLREKYGAVKWLNREDDLGLEGLRKAKLDYRPNRLVEKHWACLLEDGYDY